MTITCQPHTHSALDNPVIIDGKLTGSIYCRVVESTSVVSILKTGMLSQVKPAAESPWENMWEQIYGACPIWLSRQPWWGFGQVVFFCDLEGLRLAPDFNAIDEEWHLERENTGRFVLRDYSLDCNEGAPIATYDDEALRDPAVIEYLIGLNGEQALTCLDPIGPERIRLATADEISQLG